MGNYLFGLVLGLGLYGCGELATSTFVAQMGGIVAYKLVFINSAIDNATMLIWLIYLLQHQPKGPTLTSDRGQELERWNEALEEIIKR